MTESASNHHEAVAAGVSVLLILFILALGVGVYIFSSFCYLRICQKTGRSPGALIWIPIVRYLPLLQVAGMAEWMIVLLLLPFVNIVVFLMMWAKVCTARGKSPWLVILFFVPVANLILIPYLAFSE